MITGIAVNDFRNTGCSQQGGQLLPGQRFRVGFIVDGKQVFGLGPVTPFFYFHGIGVVHR